MTDTPASTSTIDKFRNFIACAVIGAFVGALVTLIFREIPTTNREIIVYMVGQLSGMATTALAFYFTNKAGQDALDSKRADNTGKLADAVVAAANSVPTGDVAGKAADAVAGAAADKADEITGAPA